MPMLRFGASVRLAGNRIQMLRFVGNTRLTRICMQMLRFVEKRETRKGIANRFRTRNPQ